MPIKNVADSFYNDLEPRSAQELAKKNVTHNTAPFPHKMSGAPWKVVPTTYVYCAKDMVIFIGLQTTMVKNARENGAAKLSTIACDTGRCPFLSMPAEVIGIVEKAEVALQSA